MGCHSLLQGIFPSQGLKPGLLHHRQILYRNLKDPLPLLASENNFNSPKGIPAPVHKLMQSYSALSCLLRKGVAADDRCCSFFPLALTFFQFSSVTQSYLTLCDPMNHSTISLQSKGLSRVFSNTTVQKHQFCAQLSSQSDSHIHT